MRTVRVRVVVSGLVQGVFFRDTCREAGLNQYFFEFCNINYLPEDKVTKDNRETPLA